MNRTETEALLYRMSAAFPAAKTGDAATLDEWAGSTLSMFPAAAVFAAFDEFKEQHDWPPTIHQMIETTQDVTRRRALDRQADEQRQLGQGQLITYRCGECRDEGFVVDVGPDDVITSATPVRPCASCMPATYERWRAGHYKPGHDCGECAAVRRGQRGKVRT